LQVRIGCGDDLLQSRAAAAIGAAREYAAPCRNAVVSTGEFEELPIP
jgi:hypothetical protein